jgi:hypothetical protein
VLEVIRADGSIQELAVSLDEANALVKDAQKAADAAGMGWKRQPLKLRPAAKLVALIKKSRAEAAAGAAAEDA